MDSRWVSASTPSLLNKHNDHQQSMEPIVKLASHCEGLLRECMLEVQDVESTAYSSLDRYMWRLKTWSRYSGVFAEPRINLDCRLRKKPRILDIVIRLLLTLRLHLAQLKEELTKSLDGFWACSDLAILGLSPSEEQKEMPLTYHAEAIDEALSQLSDVCVAIRHSSRSTENARARELVCDWPKMNRYELLCNIALETLYPSTPQTLLIQLCESMVNRYARQLYRAPMQEALEEDIRIPRDGQTGAQISTNTQYTTDGNNTVSKNLDVPFPHQLPGLALPSIRSSQFSDNLRKTRDQVVLSPTLVKLGNVNRPSIPTFDEYGNAQCAWCFRTIDKTLIEGGKWTAKGIDHYGKDLEPFPCVSELCAHKALGFCSRNDWAEHMYKHHAHWPQCIHRTKMWRCEPKLLEHGTHSANCVQDPSVCPSKFTHESVAYFSSTSHFMRHIKTVHNSHIDGQWSRDDLLALAENCVVDLSLSSAICPICYLEPDGLQIAGSKSMQNHIADHLQNTMLLSLRLMQTQDQAPNDTEHTEDVGSLDAALADDSQPDGDEARMNHDQVFDDDDEDDEPYWSSSSMNRPSSPTLGVISLDEQATWEEIMVDVQEIKPVKESEMDRHLSSLPAYYGKNDFDEDFMGHLPTQQSSESSMGELISDAGYSLKSTDKADERPPDPSLDLTGFGTQFDAEHGQPTGLIQNLENWIRKSRVASAEPRTLFLPIDQLERCMTAGNIKLQLRHAGVREDVEKLSDSLIKRGRASRQRIFAILCMIELSAQIGAFIREGIYDTDLPFIFKDNKIYSEVTEGSERQLKARLALKPGVWRPWYCEAFEKHQGEISPPIFKFTWAANEKVLHFSLKDELVLPFMEVKEASQEGTVDEDTEWEGGTSFVRKVKIHAAHYNAHTDAAEKNDTYFAVKELKVVNDNKKRRGYKEDREDVALKRFHDKSHPHLIRLLATYTHRNQFNLIFPWADGNLKEFWEKRFPDLGIAREDPNVVKWISAQILGLSRALKLIHYCEIDETNRQDLTADERKRLHGRHGDLKPENILWFKDRKSAQDQAVTGVLQIGDFGLADFHSKDSRSLVRRSAVNGVTETYSAPEFDVTRQVSPQFDIWSFGCILLQFVVWYMYGWHGIEEFSSERIKDSRILVFPSDNFYALEVSDRDGYKARAKNSVVEMFARLKREASSDYILDLVECIEIDLLRVDSTKRAQIADIVKTFYKLDERCKHIPGYCTVRTKVAKRIKSGLSEIFEVPEIEESGKLLDGSFVRDLRPLPSRPQSAETEHEQVQYTVTGFPQEGISSADFDLDADLPSHHKGPIPSEPWTPEVSRTAAEEPSQVDRAESVSTGKRRGIRKRLRRGLSKAVDRLL